MLDRTWLTANKEDYFVKVSNTECRILIAEGKAPFMVLGQPLYKGYYAIHDDKNGQLGFAPFKGSSKTAPYWGGQPSTDFADYVAPAPTERVQTVSISEGRTVQDAKNDLYFWYASVGLLAVSIPVGAAAIAVNTSSTA